jgi:hypothetical protein
MPASGRLHLLFSVSKNPQNHTNFKEELTARSKKSKKKEEKKRT